MIAAASVWRDDAVLYQFFVQPDAEQIPTRLFRSPAELFESQTIHYLTRNGRFFAHTLVQLFCGFLGKRWFAVCNALVWALLPWTMLKTGRIRVNFTNATISCSLVAILLSPLSLDPPMQINYSWTALITMAFLIIFFNSEAHSIRNVILYGLAGLIAGSCNECFSIPIGGALIFYAAVHKMKLAKTEWLAAITYGIGAIILIAAPGNWIRLGQASETASIGAATVERLLSAMIFPILFFTVLLSYGRKKLLNSLSNDERLFYRFMIAAWLLSCILCISLKANSGARMLIPGNLCLIILSIKIIGKSGKSAVWKIILTGFAAGTLTFIYIRTKADAEADNTIYSIYGNSQDGVVWLPDDLFIKNISHFMTTRQSYIAQSRKLYPGKPDIRLRPESMRNIMSQPNTGNIYKLDTDAWLLVSDKSESCDFIIKKILLPRLINKGLSDRVLDFSNRGDIVFDSVGDRYFGIYINTRSYISAEVIQDCVR